MYSTISIYKVQKVQKGEMEMNNMEKIRESRNLSVLDLSRKTGISERYLRFIEKGERTPSMKTAALIAIALQSTVDKIFLS